MACCINVVLSFFGFFFKVCEPPKLVDRHLARYKICLVQKIVAKILARIRSDVIGD